MKNQWKKNFYVALSVIGFLGWALYICWLPKKKFQARIDVFRDTLLRRHGFCAVNIVEQARPMVMRGISYTDWTIKLHGLIETKENSKAFARCFADNVACYANGLLDSITIAYVDGPLIVRQFGFANSDLNEQTTHTVKEKY